MTIMLARFIEGKQQLLRYFTVDSIKNLDKQAILERMVENTVEDIVINQEMKRLTGIEVGVPMSVEMIEQLKQEIFKKLLD